MTLGLFLIWLWFKGLFATSTDLVRMELEERRFNLLERKAKVLCKVAGLKPEIQGNWEAVLGIMLTLDAYRLETTLVAINDAFDWIEGRAVPSARLIQSLAAVNGYDLDPVEESAARTAIRITQLRTGKSAVFEFTLEDAMNSGRLDEWVVDWRTASGNSGKRYSVKWVMRRNGQPYGDPEQPPPEWANKLWADGQGKRFDAWWNYRKDMMWKACAVRCVRRRAPHVLLGIQVVDDVEPQFIDVQAVQVARPGLTAPSPAAASANEGQGAPIAPQPSYDQPPAGNDPQLFGSGEEPF